MAMIIYKEQGVGLHNAIRNARHWMHMVDGVWQSDNDAAVQVIIDSYDELAARKIEKADEIKAEGLIRINAIFPAVNSLDEVQFAAEQWLSIAPAARQPTPNFKRVIDIYSAAKAAIIAVNGLADVRDVKAYDATLEPVWPA